MSVNQSTYKKIGFFTALSMLIGSVIGVGIFLKNGNIFQTNNYNAVGVLIAWILGAIIAITTAYSFAEIGSSIRSRSGIAGWSEKLVGKKFGAFVKITFPLFYISILEVVLCVFLAETIFYIFDTNSTIHFGFVSLLALFLFIIFILFNSMSLKWSGRFSSITTILKFIPILAIIIAGIIYAIINKTGGLFDTNNQMSFSSKPSFSLIISSLPSVLFAFDSFTNIGNMALDIKKPEKNVSLVIIVGMITCSILYVLTTISQILVSNGNGLQFFNNSFFGDSTIREILNIVIRIFIMISVLGVVNSFSASIIRSFQSIIDEKVFFAHDFIKKISNNIPYIKDDVKSGTILSLIVCMFWFIVLIIPSLCVSKNGTDAFVDGVSNFPVIFFFLIYGILVLFGFINRFTKKVEVRKYKLFLVFAPISLIGILLVFCYVFFYQNLIQPFIDEIDLSWGLFYSNGYKVTSWMSMIWFFISLVLFLLIPYLNYFLKNKIDSRKNENLNIIVYSEKYKTFTKTKSNSYYNAAIKRSTECRIINSENKKIKIMLCNNKEKTIKLNEENKIIKVYQLSDNTFFLIYDKC